MNKVNKNKLWIKEFILVAKVAWKQFVVISILIGFLIFMLNIFLSLSVFLKYSVAPDLRDKLGMFFFVKDIPGNESIMYKEVMDIKDKLEKADMEVRFLSKEDGLEYMQKKLPLVKDFKNYGIENPIPATLYVMFNDENKYEILKKTILAHKNIIANIDVLDRGKTLKQQENRNITYLNLTNFIVVLSYVLVIILAIIILVFLVFLLDNIFQRFRKDLYVKKMLGATNSQIIKFFLVISVVVILSSSFFGFLLIFGSTFFIHYYMFQLFGVSLLSYIGSHIMIFGLVFVAEILLLLLVFNFISTRFVMSLNKKSNYRK